MSLCDFPTSIPIPGLPTPPLALPSFAAIIEALTAVEPFCLLDLWEET